jgi:hypothetical protein
VGSWAVVSCRVLLRAISKPITGFCTTADENLYPHQQQLPRSRAQSSLVNPCPMRRLSAFHVVRARHCHCAHSRCIHSPRPRPVQFPRPEIVRSGRHSRSCLVGDPSSPRRQLTSAFGPDRIGTFNQKRAPEGDVSSILARAVRAVSSSSSQEAVGTAILARRNPGCAIHLNHIGSKRNGLDPNSKPAQFNFQRFPPQRLATATHGCPPCFSLRAARVCDSHLQFRDFSLPFIQARSVFNL